MEETKQGTAKREYVEVPAGRYMARFERCEFGTSKKGRPQLVTWYRVMDGEHKKRMIFDYQQTNTEVGARIANDIYRKSQEYGMGEGGKPFYIDLVEKVSEKNPAVKFRNIYWVG